MRVVLEPCFLTGGVGRIRRTCCNRYLSDALQPSNKIAPLKRLGPGEGTLALILCFQRPRTPPQPFYTATPSVVACIWPVCKKGILWLHTKGGVGVYMCVLGRKVCVWEGGPCSEKHREVHTAVCN